MKHNNKQKKKLWIKAELEIIDEPKPNHSYAVFTFSEIQRFINVGVKLALCAFEAWL